MEHLERVLAVRTDPDLVLALQDSDEPMVSMDTLRPLAQANIAFMDGLMASASESALTAVPLLVQLEHKQHTGGTDYNGVAHARAMLL